MVLFGLCAGCVVLAAARAFFLVCLICLVCLGVFGCVMFVWACLGVFRRVWACLGVFGLFGLVCLFVG